MNKLFSISTIEGYQVKILSELLSNSLTEFNLHLTPTTISLREANIEENTILDVDIRVADIQYDPPTQPLIMGMTSTHLHKALKRIKKKDKLLLFVNAEEPEMLQSHIVNQEKERNKEACFRLKEVVQTEWQLPTYPLAPLTTILSSELARMMKEFIAVSPYLTIKIQPKGIKFTSFLQSMTQISDIYGQYDENEPDLYERKFHTKQFVKLRKLSGLAVSFKVFYEPGQEILLLKANIGTIGTLQAYLLPIKEEMEVEANNVSNVIV